MSRSRKYRRYITWSCGQSDAIAKKLFNRRFRRRNKAILDEGAEYDSQFWPKKPHWWFIWCTKKDYMHYATEDEPNLERQMRK